MRSTAQRRNGTADDESRGLIAVSLFVAAFLVQSTRADSCPSSAACDCVSVLTATGSSSGGGGTEMSCLLAGISSLPQPPPDTVRLDVRRNNITTLANNTLSSLAGLAFADLSWNSMVTVQPAAFAGLAALTELRLNNNLLARLYDYTFKDLAQLRTLQLGGNNIVALSGATFYGLLNLASLDLSGNQLSTLPSNVFVSLANLQTLNLADNVLASLPDSLLIMQSSLVSFSAAGNRITALPQTAFFGASPGVASVDLSLNRLTNVPSAFFSGATALSSVQLGGAMLVCDCTQSALRAWMDGASTTKARDAWLAAPATSGTCAQPPSLQNRYVINVSAASFVCTTTAASTFGPTTAAAAAATTTAAIVAAAMPTTSARQSGAGSQSAAGGLTTQPTADTGRLSDTIAVILGSCVGVLALLVAITLTLVLRRRCRTCAGGGPASTKDAKRASGLRASLPSRIVGGGNGSGDGPGGRQAGNTFSPPTKHVQMMAPTANGASTRVAELQPPPTANGSLTAGTPAQTPPKMNGLVPYAHARRSRGSSYDQPDSTSVTDGRGLPRSGPAVIWPKGQGDGVAVEGGRPPAFYVDPGTPHAGFVQRHASAYLSARSIADGRWFELTRNAPSTSSLRAAKPAHLQPTGGGGFAPTSSEAEATGRSASYGGGWHRPTLLAPGGRLAIVAPDGHPQVTVLPSQGSVDSGVHSLTPYMDAGTPSTYRSFSPLSNDALFVTDPLSKPPMLEPRRYKNDTFV